MTLYPKLDEIFLLEKQDITTLADWWGQLNRNEWPPEIPDPPGLIYPCRGPSVTRDHRWAIMCWIMDHISYKECLRHWNKETLPGKKFDEWWESDMKAHHT